MKTDQELKQLAADIYENKVFTDRHLQERERDHQVGLTFYPVLFGAFDDMKEEEQKEISMLYEYMDKAASRSCNGHPIFMSVRFLTKKEHERMNYFYEEYRAIKESFLK